jgi:ribonuclease HII
MSPTFDEERALHAHGATAIAGVDEVGRGCWAGPVMAAAVVFDADVYGQPERLAGVDDSKRLTSTQRTALVQSMHPYIRSAAIGWVSAHDIDCMGIIQATRVAMQQAVFGLTIPVDALLIDAVSFPHWSIPQHSFIHGDSRSLSIAAASIIAKVARDRIMQQLDTLTPHYGYATHKGYGTPVHQQALMRHGPSIHHRHTYAPIRSFHLTGAWGFRRSDAERV